MVLKPLSTIFQIYRGGENKRCVIQVYVMWCGQNIICIYNLKKRYWCFYHFLENKKTTKKSQPLLVDYGMIAVVIFWN